MTGRSGIVLCGGRSSRMGRPKAWLPWRGRPMVAHVVDTLRRIVDDVVVVSTPGLALPPLPAQVVCDPEPGLGPLAGITEGLAHVEADLAFVTSTDAPFLAADFVEALFAFGGAAAPLVEGRVQTLAAVYPRGALSHGRDLLARGRRRPLDLLEAVAYREVQSHELPGTDSLRGFNTPLEYLEAVRELEAAATARLGFEGRARRLAGRSGFEVPVGTLAEVLDHAPAGLSLRGGADVAATYRVSLGGCEVVTDSRIPVGPGEHVVVHDSRVEEGS
jgi:molybdopterin-guanine dinucleotide biosynthesis protein A